MSLEALKPVMSEDGGFAQGTHKIVKDESKRSLTETATLKSGVEVTYTVGGCAHYAFSYVFKGFEAGKTDPLELASSLLKQVPLEDASEMATVLHILKTAQESNVPPEELKSGFACGDAWCLLKLEAGTLVFAYDFPL